MRLTLEPDISELIARARNDLRGGLGVVLDGPGGAALVLAVETLQPARLAAALALGSATLALTARRAATLKARAYDGDLARIPVPADARAGWLMALADPAGDLATPMKGPLVTLREGNATTHRAALRLTKAARLLPAALVVPLPGGTAPAGLTRIATQAVLSRAEAAARLRPVAQARLPMSISADGRLHVFRPEDGGEEHYAVEIGSPDRGRPVLTRLHSACFTGDLLGSLKCDCGPQLRGAMAAMAAEGGGVLLYLNQEGRGIGLANKMRAYALQDQGFDTVEANHRLGFEDDERDFRLGAAILDRLGFASVRLMTNNPAKVAMLQACGTEVVERVPLAVGRGALNAGYLDTKAAKSGHLL